MRARIIGKSSAARARVTFPPFSCDAGVIPGRGDRLNEARIVVSALRGGGLIDQRPIMSDRTAERTGMIDIRIKPVPRRRGRERSGRLRAEPDILAGKFAAGVVEDRLIAQPVYCFACASGRPFQGHLGLAERRIEASIPNPRNRPGDVARAEMVEDCLAVVGARTSRPEFSAREMP
jgi:hypothetical protein